jgi:hypothetical protein
LELRRGNAKKLPIQAFKVNFKFILGTFSTFSPFWYFFASFVLVVFLLNKSSFSSFKAIFAKFFVDFGRFFYLIEYYFSRGGGTTFSPKG